MIGFPYALSNLEKSKKARSGLPLNLTLEIIMSTEEILSDLKREAFSGELSNASAEKLNRYAAALCHPQAFSVFGAHEFPQVCETVRIHLLRAHIETLQKHITTLNEKNALTQKLVIALTVAALLTGIPQIWLAYKADKRSELETKTIAASQLAQPIESAVPSLVAPQASGQPTRKAP